MNRCRTASGIRKPPEGITDDRNERCVRAGDEARRMARRNDATSKTGWRGGNTWRENPGTLAGGYVQYRKLTPRHRCCTSSSACYLRWKGEEKKEAGEVDRLQVRQCERPVASASDRSIYDYLCTSP